LVDLRAQHLEIQDGELAGWSDMKHCEVLLSTDAVSGGLRGPRSPAIGRRKDVFCIQKVLVVLKTASEAMIGQNASKVRRRLSKARSMIGWSVHMGGSLYGVGADRNMSGTGSSGQGGSNG
jgi:hypothetical protein